MLTLDRHQDFCRQFAALLRYPGQDIAQRASACAAGLHGVCPPAAAAIERFAAFAAGHGLSHVEEAYTGTFELQALCHPYVGYQLCGENQQRTFFMLRLKELYSQHGFSCGNELPDHFSEMLQFVGTIDDLACRQELIDDGLLPAMARCLSARESDRLPYLELLKGLQRFLTETADRAEEPGEAALSRQKEYLS